MSDDQKMCQICGESPVGEGYMSMMCPQRRARIEEQNRTLPYPLLPRQTTSSSARARCLGRFGQRGMQLDHALRMLPLSYSADEHLLGPLAGRW
ncbi:hypothetical protein [Nocardia sp. NPDC004711]